MNGSKIWINNRGVAQVTTVFAQRPVKDRASGKTVDKISAFIIERSFGGVTNGVAEKKKVIKYSNTAEVYFDNDKILVENLLGDEGNGFKIVMNNLNTARIGESATIAESMKTSITTLVKLSK